MTRFIVTDHTAAAAAVQQLPAAVHELATVIDAAAQALRDLAADATPQHSLDALVSWQQKQRGVERAKAEVVRLLSDAGASPRGLGTALNVNRSTIERLVAMAKAERETS